MEGIFDLVEALRREDIPAITDPAGADHKDAVFAQVRFEDGTFLLIADDEWFLWGRCDGDTGEFTDETAECDVIEHHADLAAVAREVRDLIHTRGWKPVQPPPQAGDNQSPADPAGTDRAGA